MLIWINGAFGAGKTQTAHELHRRLLGSWIFDPEEIGFFLRRMLPEVRQLNDFQDYPLWRQLSVQLLAAAAQEKQQPVIVPMTLVNPTYFSEIMQGLQQLDVDVRHFALLATPETLYRRLQRRGDGRGSWPAQQVDRCVAALAAPEFTHHLYTDERSIAANAEAIAQHCGLALGPRGGPFRTRLQRWQVQLQHIRWGQ